MVVVKTDVEGVDIYPDEPGQVVRKDLVGPEDGAPNFSMRQFHLSPGSSTPKHAHDWEHEVLIVEGGGTLVHEHGDSDFEAGDTVFVPPRELHQFQNTEDAPLTFICVVPNSGHVAGLTSSERDRLVAAGIDCDG
jgi:quercetin dioxygenase-like cupin family protein